MLSSLPGNSAFKTGDYTVTRTVAGTYVNGRLVDGSTSTLSIAAAVQPLNGDDLKVLPEAHHSENTRKIYTSTELFTRTDAQAPDTIAIDGATWIVVNVRKYTAFGDTHFKALVARKIKA